MIISRTPFRVSFLGGGSDLPVFYRRFGGAVLSTTIDQHVYVTINKKFDEKIRISYSRTEEVRSVDRIRHPLVREAMKLLGLRGGVEITSVADLPARGTGLGSSSSFTVGLLHVLHAYAERYASAVQLAREACEIEITRCAEPIGKQDQFSAAFGGLNFIQFHPDDTVTVEPVICRKETLRQVQAELLFFYTGLTRSASGILKHQQRALSTEKKKQTAMRKMVDLARQLRVALQRNQPEALGALLHESWYLKKSLAPDISSSVIDRWYETARRAGASGGKLLGAGAGGFLMFSAPVPRHEAIARALHPLRQMHFRFETQGSSIIFVHH